MRVILSELRTVDDKPRRIVLKYLIEVADAPKDTLLTLAKQCLTHDEEIIMTVGEQLREEGRHQGLYQGLEQGLHEGEHKKAVDCAKKLLMRGFPIEDIASLTELTVAEVHSLKTSLTH